MQNPVRHVCSQRVNNVETPIIPTITQLAREHPGTDSLGQGVAFYGPPQEAYDEIRAPMHSSALNAYGPVEGIGELTAALAEKLHARNNIACNGENRIFVTAGSNMAFSSLMLAIADSGEEIILLTPYYFNHEMAIRLAGAIPILVPTLDNFHPDIERIEQAITRKTRAIVTVSPNNPSGAVYSQQELTAINELCARHGLYHISDEAYEDFIYAGNRHFSAASIDGAAAHTISLFSLSKAYGFAGWRVGYMLIPTALFASMRKVQDTVLISPTIISQYAALGAQRAPYTYIQNHLRSIANSRQTCLTHLNALPLLTKPVLAEGAFYLFLALNTEMDDLQLATRLIQEHQVATIPGSAFAAHHGTYLRVSYGSLTGAALEQALHKLTRGLQAIITC